MKRRIYWQAKTKQHKKRSLRFTGCERPRDITLLQRRRMAERAARTA